MRRIESRSLAWLLAATAVALMFCAGMFVSPWLESLRSGPGAWLRMVYAPACHQMPTRCLDLGHGPLAVCARCAGLYLGGMLGMLITLIGRRSFRPTIRWLLVVSVPTVADFAANLVGLPSLPNWPRFWIAVPAGLLLGLALADAIADIGRSPTTRAHQPAGDALQSSHNRRRTP
jgi:uncharacterized membrane protein